MTVKKEINIKEFAQRVERLCDFFMDKLDKDGSQDRKVLEDLKEHAADIQVHQKLVEMIEINPIQGLSDFVGA